MKPTNSFSFFTGVFLFSFGFLIDYSSLYSEGHKYLGFIGSVLSAVFVGISLLGLAQILDISMINNEYMLVTGDNFMGKMSMNIKVLVKGLLLFSFLAGYELIIVCFNEDSEGLITQKSVRKA